MSHAVMRIEQLPAGALEAAAQFHREWVHKARASLSGKDSLTIVLAGATYDHLDWRRAAARDLARAAAPARVNIIAGGDEAAIDSALAFLADAAGVTGQYLPLAVQTTSGEPS